MGCPLPPPISPTTSRASLTDIQGFLCAWERLRALPNIWWPEVGRMSDGSWYCEITHGAPVPHLVGPSIRVIAATATEAINQAVDEMENPRSLKWRAC